MSLFAPLLLIAATPVVADPPLVAGPVLTAAVEAADTRFFALFFDGCDPVALRAMLTDDFEMYHDRGGVVARAADPFVAEYASQCAARAAPDSWRSRRELVRASLHVDPVPGFGAIEEGDHLFYERRGDGAERLAGRAHFVQLWQQTSDGWKLSRVLSYAHVAAEQE